MASESTARPKDPVIGSKKTSGVRPRAPQPEARVPSHEIAPPPPGPTDLALGAEGSVDFEAHDTIPAPPWLDDDAP
jgi:hypothetical protein